MDSIIELKHFPNGIGKYTKACYKVIIDGEILVSGADKEKLIKRFKQIVREEMWKDLETIASYTPGDESMIIEEKTVTDIF